MRKVALMAYMNANLGDDLFLRILCQRYPNVQFYIRGNYNGKCVARDLTNLKYLEYNDKTSLTLLCKVINQIYKKILRQKEYDHLIERCQNRILISGSCFMESIGEKVIDSHEYFIDENTFVIGCNFGPYKNQEYFRRYLKILSKAKFVCFREQYSYKLFKENPNTYYASDIVFNYNKENVILPNIKDYVLLAVAPIAKDGRKDLEKYEEIYIQRQVEVVQNFIARRLHVVLLSFCESEDKRVADKIFEKLGDNNQISMVHYPHISADEAVGYIANAKAVLSTRYHAMILALLFGKKVFSISYSQKIKNVVEDLGNIIPYCNIEDLIETSAEEIALELEKNYTQKELEQIQRYVELSKNHFMLIDREFGIK